MAFDTVLPNQILPKQNIELILLLIGWYNRALQAHIPWAEEAKKCTQYVEGEQISETDKATMDEQGRPLLTINKIAPLVRLVLGYHRNNRTDEKIMPGFDGTGIEETAQAITHLFKQINEQSQQRYIDAEVFQDGIITGRSYWDTRLNFEHNDLGECMTDSSDPFSTLLDPDGNKYDLNKSNYVISQTWMDMQKIAALFGPEAVELTGGWLSGSGYAGMASSIFVDQIDITPWRSFGGEGDVAAGWSQMLEYSANIVDPARASIRVVEFQYYQHVRRGFFVDMETGYKHPIPSSWNQEKVMKAKAFWDYQFQQVGKVSPLAIDVRPGRRLRWTVLIGDVVVFDKWSIYETFTKTAFFPWFRRGKTRGMVADLIDPQNEINKRRSAFVDILTRTASGGWMIHEGAMDPEEIERLEDFGASPGYVAKWRGEAHMKPEVIKGTPPPRSMERAEQKGSEDLHDISGLNKDALGSIDKVQSGRAIEAKQRQAVIAVQIYMDNMSRSKELLGRKKLEIIQAHYTEERVVRTLGESGKPIEMIINQRIAGQIIHNVTMGRYSLVIDETPLSASFAAAQFEELLQLIEKGVLPVAVVQDIIVDLSSVPNKELIKRRIQTLMMAQGIPVGDDIMTDAGQALLQAGAAQEAAGQGGPPIGGATSVQPTQSITQGAPGAKIIPIGGPPNG